MKRIQPWIALLLLGPILGELVSGHQTLWEFINPLNFVLLALPYGFGAIICRELKVRWSKGWFCLVLLGIAFGIYEEAIVARSFWDPAWSELGALGEYSYWKGASWLFAQILIHFHLTISILCSVVLAEIIYPDRRNEPWINRWGLAVCAVGLALWMPAMMVVNPYMPSIGAFVLSWVAIAGLGYAAWRLPAHIFPARAGMSVPPLGYGILAAVNTTLVFESVFMLPEQNLSWLPAWPVLFVFVALLDVAAFGIVMRWSGNGTDWDDRHKLALVMGLLAFFIVLDAVDIGSSFSGLSIVAVVTMWGLWNLWRRTRARYAAKE